MGNSYFAKKGISIIALSRTNNTQKEHLDAHLKRLDMLDLKHLSKDKIKQANKLINADSYTFSLGKADFELRYVGDSHFLNDAVLWLPKQKILFTGDMIFNGW